jgi:hypothetical protein
MNDEGEKSIKREGFLKSEPNNKLLHSWGVDPEIKNTSKSNRLHFYIQHSLFDIRYSSPYLSLPRD